MSTNSETGRRRRLGVSTNSETGREGGIPGCYSWFNTHREAYPGLFLVYTQGSIPGWYTRKYTQGGIPGWYIPTIHTGRHTREVYTLIHTGKHTRVVYTSQVHREAYIPGLYPSYTQGGIYTRGIPLIHTQGGIYPGYSPVYTPREAYTRVIACYTPLYTLWYTCMPPRHPFHCWARRGSLAPRRLSER